MPPAEGDIALLPDPGPYCEESPVMVEREVRLSGASPAAASMAMRLCTGGTGADASGPRTACRDSEDTSSR